MHIEKKFSHFTYLSDELPDLICVFFQSNNDEQPKILAELEESIHSEGTVLFIFSLTNIGKSQASLEFPTWLE
ncbi:MAG: hypothetical protein ACQEV7_01560 [Bacillota bacterium]